MRVSVIIPGYRYEFIGETIKSLEEQTVQPHEILYEHSKDVAAKKINRLAKIATGDAVIVLSDDDKLAPTFIEKTSQAMDKGADIVYTDMLRFGALNHVIPASPWTFENFKISTVPWMTSLIRKDIFDKLGGWDADQEYQDYDFYYRCFKAGARHCHIPEPLFLYRIHDNSGSFNMNHDRARAKLTDKHPELI